MKTSLPPASDASAPPPCHPVDSWPARRHRGLLVLALLASLGLAACHLMPGKERSARSQPADFADASGEQLIPGDPAVVAAAARDVEQRSVAQLEGEIGQLMVPGSFSVDDASIAVDADAVAALAADAARARVAAPRMQCLMVGTYLDKLGVRNTALSRAAWQDAVSQLLRAAATYSGNTAPNASLALGPIKFAMACQGLLDLSRRLRAANQEEDCGKKVQLLSQIALDGNTYLTLERGAGIINFAAAVGQRVAPNSKKAKDLQMAAMLNNCLVVPVVRLQREVRKTVRLCQVPPRYDIATDY